MKQCVRQGIRIKVIHHLNREIEEVSRSMRDWFVLYMSGMVESYYRKRQNDGCFSHVLFFAEGVGCIAGANIIGVPESTWNYRFFTEPEEMAKFRTGYDYLLSTSRPLITTCSGIRCRQQPPLEGKKIKMFGASFSLGTMPEEVLQSALQRYHADEPVRQAALSEWRMRRERLMDKVRTGTVEEYVPVAAPGEEDRFLMDIPEQRFYYTPEEYRCHLEAVAQFQKEHSSYTFYPLPGALFPNTLIRFDETVVRISRLSEPFFTYLVTHPALTESFDAYAKKLRSISGNAESAAPQGHDQRAAQKIENNE